ncbi:copper homeostasis protein CutC [Sphingomonas mucosissima]|uniref:PF03932 family protein CutC n=1 Tax=Sphingomonas mucosissima TaxID=370959 RepID=A0A245ZJF1_9SPHN|nr:glutamine--fructose-6-phosphate aminotransferase [Sphingomonas mucosissima]
MAETLIEICVDSPEGLAAAVEGGADRIKLASSLALSGLSPSAGLMALARDCPLPVSALIRPREGGMVYGDRKRTAMFRDIDAARAAGLEGVAIGALTPDGKLDIAMIEALVAHAAGLSVSLHRAVDLLPDPVAAVSIAADLGITAILTSGGARSASDGIATIKAMQWSAGDRVTITASGGLHPRNVAELVAATGVRAVQAFCSRPIGNPSPRAVELGFESELSRVTDRAEVAAMRAALGRPAPTRVSATPPAKQPRRDPATTLMHAEAAEAPDVVARLIDRNSSAMERIATRLRDRPPPFIITCARGSSDHAATYGKYLFETMTGIPVASGALSVASIFGAPLRAEGALCLAISQSGRSPDLLASVAAYKAGGAFVVALVNDEASPLAEAVHEVLPLCAGPERSVAATKSFIAALATQAALAAAWARDDRLLPQIAALPAAMSRAFALDWQAAHLPLLGARNMFVLGRGHGLGIAQEAALKFKETCGLHAEAFSAAEVRHGPMAIVGRGFPILAFATSDASGDDVRSTVAQFGARGARIMLADGRGGGNLPAIATAPTLEPILMIQSFYRMVNQLAVARGIDPDAPPHLKKVTETR